jgi:hypothetical protein
MSEHQQFLGERDKLDYFIQKGFRITSVNEHLDGASVNFLNPAGNETEIVLIGTANGRKYLSSLLMKQNQAIN